MNAHPRNMANKQPFKLYFMVVKNQTITALFSTTSLTRAEMAKQASGELVEVTENEYNLLLMCDGKLNFIRFLVDEIEKKARRIEVDKEQAVIDVYNKVVGRL